MEEKGITPWEAFKKTGHIEAYLLYKSARTEDEEDKEDTWQRSEQEVLS